MDASRFDQRHYPTLAVQEGYTVWAASYDDATMKELMDYRLLARITAVAWEQIETAADLACGTGRIGSWLKARGVRVVDGVDLTAAMLAHARRKGIYRTLCRADLRQTPLQNESYDLVSVVLADEHIPDVLPLYREAARLARPQGHLVLVGYHPFFQLSGIPTTFERSMGEPATIAGYVHLFSEHVQAATRCGWVVREMHESLIDAEWLAWRPRAAPRAGWPVSFAFLWQREHAA